MSSNLKLLFAGLFLLAAAYKIQAADQQLQCWHCSSDTVGAEDFCGTIFDPDSIPTEMMKERNISVMRTCNTTINSDHERAVCRKTVEEINGKEVTKRHCYYTNKSDPMDHCNEEPLADKNVRRLFCEDCTTHKCNAAAQMAAQLCGILLPVFVAKVFVI